MIAGLGALQLDSVNVLVRSHYLPLFSRLGPYAMDDLDRLAWGGRRRGLFEYWGHEASLLPLALHPLFRWRMARARAGETWGGLSRLARERPEFVDAVLREVSDRGPIGASDLSEGGRATGPWWGWSDGKTALEWLFWAGLVTAAGRRGFERLYDVPERVLPAWVLDLPTPAEADAHRELLDIAARASGVATEADLGRYFRLPPAAAKARLAELVETGTLSPVRVEGWQPRAYLHRDAAHRRRLSARALVSPFDSLVWSRPRTERLFGFHYRLAFYTPKHRRTGGYYVMPFLLGDRLVARVDLKADRKARALVVHGGHTEAGQSVTDTAGPLAEELRLIAAWLGLDRVVAGEGALAAAVAAELR
jgi:hypothetical protein